MTYTPEKPYLPLKPGTYTSSTKLSTNKFTLPAYGGDPDHITLSGFASGSSMATRMHVIYSKTFKGVGLISGGPYGPPKLGDISDQRYIKAAQ